MDRTAAEFERYLHAQIPLTRAMAISVMRVDGQGVRLRAALAPNSVDFIAPARGDLEAYCIVPPASQWTHFIDVLKRKGKARIDMHAMVEASDVLVARFEGRYIALRE